MTIKPRTPDVLEPRDYNPGIDHTAEQIADVTFCYNYVPRNLAQHVVDLKAEVVRLRATAHNVVLSAEEEHAVDRANNQIESSEYAGRCEYEDMLRDLLFIVHRICPPKKPKTDMELADEVARIASCLPDGVVSDDLNAVAKSLRDRGGE